MFSGILFLLLGYILQLSGSLNIPCNLQQKKYGFVCKCTAEYCDYLDEPPITADTRWVGISSSEGGLRFSSIEGEFGSKTIIDDYHELFNADAVMVDISRTLFRIYEGNKNYYNSRPKTTVSSITINRSKTFQSIVGFGGALTGSCAHLINNLQHSLQYNLYKSYFHKSGIAYNMLRITIGGCDFDLEPWAYNELPQNDQDLTNFTKLDERDLVKVKQIKEIKRVAEMDEIKIIAAAWSPPRWMKSNNNWTGFSSLKREYYKTWANYHLKFLELMAAKGVKIWAISTGNEPLNGVIGWYFVHFMSLGWTPTNQAIYLAEFLGPSLKRSQFKNVLIFGNDDQRYSFPTWFQKMNFSSSKALDYLDGLAVHWYWDDLFGPELIDATLKLMPNKLLLNTEACSGDKPWQTHGPELGSWKRGEKYIRSVLQDLQHNFNGWMDWNLLLDLSGGPTYINNTVDAAIIVNTSSNAEFYKQPMYYAIGHFSKFITEHSRRIEVKLLPEARAIDAVGFERPDKKIVLIIYNSAPIPQDINLNDSIRGIFTINAPARSVHTIIYM